MIVPSGNILHVPLPFEPDLITLLPCEVDYLYGTKNILVPTAVFGIKLFASTLSIYSLSFTTTGNKPEAAFVR